MNTCENCENIINSLVKENDDEYLNLKNIYDKLIMEKTFVKNYSYLLMNILFFLINNYIGVLNFGTNLNFKDLINEHIDYMNILIENSNFILKDKNENISFEMIKDIYHIKDGQIYFKKMYFNEINNKLEYNLEIPKKTNNINETFIYFYDFEEIYKLKNFEESGHHCDDLINFLNNELENIQKDKKIKKTFLNDIIILRNKFLNIIKNFIYIENELYHLNINNFGIRTWEKKKYFIKIIWGNMIHDKLIQKKILSDIIREINKEGKINLKFSDNNVFCAGINYLGWEKID